jgi:ketosteroid isomerase-like protein
MMARAALFVVVLIIWPLTGLSGEKPADVATIVAHHLAAAERGDVDSMMRDYAPYAVLITPDTAITGKRAIRSVFQRLVGGNAGPGGSPAALQVQKQVFTGNVGYLLWVQHLGTPDEVHGSDTFIIREGQIVVQTVAMIADSGGHK